MVRLICTTVVTASFAVSGWTQDSKPSSASRAPAKKPDFPPHATVLDGYEKVVSTSDGARSLFTIWKRDKDGQMFAELPRNFASQKFFIALTVSSGERFAGLRAGDMYVYFRRYDKRLAMIEPNITTRSTGDQESKDSVKRLFTDRVILDMPIVTMGPGGGPVIDMDALLVGQSSSFFGSSVRSSNSRLIRITKAKAFPKNVEVAFETPTSRGRLQSLHYSISAIPDSTGYKPRKADERVGYFVTSYTDLGQYDEDKKVMRYITRWHLEKRDPKLKISPPVRPIVFYIEHTTPVRYRRWVREGILYWNKAFEKVGISDAIEVNYQDAKLGTNGGHMDKDPEDVRWNFVRWLNNDIATAIGPSRIHPLTGEILDADIILTDGWIRHYLDQFRDVLPNIAMQGFSSETLAWLNQHPNWDPRVRLAAPSQRPHLVAQLAKRAASPFGGHELTGVDSKLLGDDRYDGLVGRTSQVNGLCLASQGKAFDLAILRMTLDLMAADDKEGDGDDDKEGDDKKAEAKKEKKEEESKIDGMPESFIGPLLAELVAHEVGHTLGLRHNFKASSIYSLDEINSEEVKDKKPLAGSVMDYLPINMRLEAGKLQGNHTMLGIGPYDFWAIEYGYSFDKDLKPILDRVAEPELRYGTDEDTGGPDPLARRYDFSRNPLDYAVEQIKLAAHHRERLLEKFVKDGESWAKARQGYELTLSLQMRAVSMMANWLGGAFVHRDKKGDPNERVPIVVVPAEKQRKALKFVIENTFSDDAYGLTPDILRRMTVDKWLDNDGFSLSFFEEPTWPVHDRIMGMQASTLTMLLNPTTLRRVYDNEFLVPAEDDALTLPELLSQVSKAIWTELKSSPDKEFTARKPMISSLRRNLQQEHLQRLVDLVTPRNGGNEANKPISDLAMLELKQIQAATNRVLSEGEDKVDPYTKAHLTKIQDQIKKVLDSQYIYNAKDIGGGGTPSFIILGNEGDEK